MNIKRTLCTVIALLLLVGLTACSRNNNQNESSVAQGQDEVSLDTPGAGNSMDDESSAVELGSGEEFSDDNVKIDVSLSKEEYTLSEAVELKVTITNTADRPIVYVVGSGSNVAPDALQLDLDRFTAMFRPFAMTMDYGVHTLEAGESITYELPFAPYTAVDEDVEPAGLDRDIEYFQSEFYNPVEHGEYEGTLTFTYVISDNEEMDGAALDLIDNNEAHEIKGTFKTRIIADNDSTMDGNYSDADGILDDDDGVLNDED